MEKISRKTKKELENNVENTNTISDSTFDQVANTDNNTIGELQQTDNNAYTDIQEQQTDEDTQQGEAVTDDIQNDEQLQHSEPQSEPQTQIENNETEIEHHRLRQKNVNKSKISFKKIFKLIFLLIVVVAVSIGIKKGFDAVGQFLASRQQNISTTSQDITITSTGTLDYENFQKGVLVANAGIVTYYNAKMEALWEIQGFAGLPVIHTNGRYALVAYSDTPNALLITGSDSIPVTCSGKIVSSYVNKNGHFALVLTEDGYKNQIAVFDNNGNVIYKWHSAENYVTGVAISPDNESMAAATIGFTENGFDSGIMMFDLAQNIPCSGQHQSDNLIMDIEFVSNNRLVAIGDKCATYYKKDGKALNTIDYEGKKLITFDVAESGRTILCFARDDSSMSSCDIYSYKTNAKESGHFETSGKVLSVSSCGANVLVAKDSEFDLLTDKCRKLRTTSIVRDLKNSVLFNDGRFAFVISGNMAQIIKVH